MKKTTDQLYKYGIDEFWSDIENRWQVYFSGHASTDTEHEVLGEIVRSMGGQTINPQGDWDTTIAEFDTEAELRAFLEAADIGTIWPKYDTCPYATTGDYAFEYDLSDLVGTDDLEVAMAAAEGCQASIIDSNDDPLIAESGNPRTVIAAFEDEDGLVAFFDTVGVEVEIDGTAEDYELQYGG